MTTASFVPLFVGPVELMLLGAVILVLLFGSRATDVARDAGSTVGKVNKSRRAAEAEIDDVRSDLKEGVEPVKEEVDAVEQEVKAVEEEVEEFESEVESVEDDIEPTGDTGHSPDGSDRKDN